MKMYFQKTDKAVAELASRQRTLGLKERALLLLADGKKTGPELASLVQAQTTLLHTLVHQGYLEPVRATAPEPPASTNSILLPEAGKTASVPAAKAKNQVKTEKTEDSPPATTPPVRAAADTFEGKRSLATARMFLFDLSERMFARRDPELVLELREAFRDARDRESMLAVARKMPMRIEEEAGAARADEISARLAMLLPTEVD